ncbi:hypothetical protein C8R43DRAFT_957716 [Mycena crocata]|nr:hypothetical protein C8R43DRAFT_957716 [Mycena crocata]
MASQTKNLAKVHGYRGRTRAWISRANPCIDIEGEPVHGYQGRTRAWISRANPCMNIEGEPVHGYQGRTKFLGKWPPGTVNYAERRPSRRHQMGPVRAPKNPKSGCASAAWMNPPQGRWMNPVDESICGGMNPPE